jgi:hypothetical protein
MTCNSCGGLIGRDCFNPQECAWITESMNNQPVEQEEQLGVVMEFLDLANETIFTMSQVIENLEYQLSNTNH